MQQRIANGIALVYKSIYGRGPTKVVAHVHPDVVLVLLEDVNTPGQVMLVDLGEISLVNTVHSRLQRGMEQALIAVVEEATGRGVRVYVPGYDARHGVATDTFVLEPDEGQAPEKPA